MDGIENRYESIIHLIANKATHPLHLNAAHFWALVFSPIQWPFVFLSRIQITMQCQQISGWNSGQIVSRILQIMWNTDERKRYKRRTDQLCASLRTATNKNWRPFCTEQLQRQIIYQNAQIFKRN